jgi:hypothetical protein
MAESGGWGVESLPKGSSKLPSLEACGWTRGWEKGTSAIPLQSATLTRVCGVWCVLQGSPGGLLCLQPPDVPFMKDSGKVTS